MPSFRPLTSMAGVVHVVPVTVAVTGAVLCSLPASLATTVTVEPACTVPPAVVVFSLAIVIGLLTAEILSAGAVVSLVEVRLAVPVLPVVSVATAVNVTAPSLRVDTLSVAVQVVPVTVALTVLVLCAVPTSVATTVTVAPACTVPVTVTLFSEAVLISGGTLLMATVGATVSLVEVEVAVAVLLLVSVSVAV